MQASTVYVRRSSGELEGGWTIAGEPRWAVSLDAEVVRVRRSMGGLLFVEKDVLPEALAMWQEEAAQGAEVRPLEEGPLLPSVDRIALADELDAILGGG